MITCSSCNKPWLEHNYLQGDTVCVRCRKDKLCPGCLEPKPASEFLSSACCKECRRTEKRKEKERERKRNKSRKQEADLKEKEKIWGKQPRYKRMPGGGVMQY